MRSKVGSFWGMGTPTEIVDRRTYGGFFTVGGVPRPAEAMAPSILRPFQANAFRPGLEFVNPQDSAWRLQRARHHRSATLRVSIYPVHRRSRPAAGLTGGERQPNPSRVVLVRARFPAPCYLFMLFRLLCQFQWRCMVGSPLNTA